MSLAPDSLHSGLLNVETELSHWQRVVFRGDMTPSPNSGDDDKRDSDPPVTTPSSPPSPESHGSATSATNDQQASSGNPFLNGPQLTPEMYNYLIHALLTLQQLQYPLANPGAPAGPGGLGYNPAMLLGHLAQGIMPIHGGSSLSPATSSFASNITGPSSGHPQDFRYGMVPPLFPGPVSQPATSPTQPITQSASMSRDPQSVEASEDPFSTAEDKRRRNTAASARFRIKKKLKTLHLERNVDDLGARAEELEREATDLRRENAWLKEIILLKARNVGGSSSQPMESSHQHPQERDGNDLSSEGKKREKGKGKKTGR